MMSIRKANKRVSGELVKMAITNEKTKRYNSTLIQKLINIQKQQEEDKQALEKRLNVLERKTNQLAAELEHVIENNGFYTVYLCHLDHENKENDK